MKNEDAMHFFELLIQSGAESGVEKYGHDNSHMDAEFILRYADQNTSILDIGSGTGLIINKIAPFVAHITAVEPFREFTKHIIRTRNIEIIHENIFSLITANRYDLVTLFGFSHYLNKKEIKEVYHKCYQWLKNKGKIIIKNQFGVNEDVTVSGYSEELKTKYYAQYRHIDSEIKLLQEVCFEDIEIFDIYPPECNKWGNTNFYAIVAGKDL
jgi:cyclopropane fatty-acyl-phospholipid synthase-like methyltransferase